MKVQHKKDTRAEILARHLPHAADHGKLSAALAAAKGDWPATIALLKDQLPAPTLARLDMVHTLAEWTGDQARLVSALLAHKDVATLRDVALHFDLEKTAAAVDPGGLPNAVPGATPAERRRNFATALNTKLFHAQTSAVLQRMAKNNELPIADAKARAHVAAFFANLPEFNIRTTSLYSALRNPDALKHVPEGQQSATIAQLKVLQRVQALSPTPEAVPALMKAGLTSAFGIADMGETTFLNAYSAALGGEDSARLVYTAALQSRIRNEHALTTMHESMRGTGLAILDGEETRAARIERLQGIADRRGVPLDLSSLFDTDFCECDDCLSVYSPAAYFVELLNYLRNNNLDPKNPNTGQAGFAGTPLEKLFRRRPDLGCLELTCENTFTVLPYLDLVNEVLESFIVHQANYDGSSTDPTQRQAFLDVFNVADETSGELLAQPQHVNYQAYCILKSAVYPFTLPYHQPIDAIRIFLDYLGTSRYELLDTFRTALDTAAAQSTSLTASQVQQLQKLHPQVLERAADAEYLGMTQEEYIILTREAFWPKEYFAAALNQPALSDADYRKGIGVKPVHAYYGYQADADMLSTDEAPVTGQKGLRFVKKQFLRRTGIQYTDLVDLLKTRYINPDFPQGKALTLLEGVRFSYRFLQTLVDTGAKDLALRYAKLIQFLGKAQSAAPLIDAMLHPDPCKQRQRDPCADRKHPAEDVSQWVYCYFERLGKLIVLESGEGTTLVVHPQGLAVTLQGVVYDSKKTPVAYLRSDGAVLDAGGKKLIGQVGADFAITWADRQTFAKKFGSAATLFILGQDGTTVLGRVAASGLWEQIGDRRPVREGGGDTCDLDKVRLVHLDGSPLVDEEYDRMQRFIRLWRKCGWTIDETDRALTGSAPLSGGSGGGGGTPLPPAPPAQEALVDFGAFSDDCGFPAGGLDRSGNPCVDASKPWPCHDPVHPGQWGIDPEFLHQLVAIRKLATRTGLALPKLLTFWADIGIVGEKSLYASLFLTHNLVAIDGVFKPDRNGNYLTEPARISDHLPVLMAAFKLKAEDIAAIMQYRKLADDLNLSSVSVLYRHALLARLLHVKPTLVGEVIDLCGDPFVTPQAALALLDLWQSMEDAGFSFAQLNYIVRDRDDPAHPLAPAAKTVLVTAKTLYDGLNAIDRDHPDLANGDLEKATDERVRAKAGLLFEPSVVEDIVALLGGTTVYATNAPTGLSLTVPADLVKKLRYDEQPNANPPAANLRVTGILTPAENVKAKTLSSDPEWAKAIDRVGKQPQNIFNSVLAGMFPDTAAAKQVLTAGDVALPDPQDPANTAPQKRLYFLQYFLPFLRRQLSHRLIVQTMAKVCKLAADITDSLLSDILLAGTPAQAAAGVLEQIKFKSGGTNAGWAGYLLPSIDGAYTFAATGDTQPADLLLDGAAIAFSVQQEDPSNVWFTDPATPVKLKAGRLYRLELADRSADLLSWRTPISSLTRIPPADFLPDYSKDGMQEVLGKLTKCALLVKGFALRADEVNYIQSHGADFAGFDFNAITLGQWERLQAYSALRNRLPKSGATLLDLFGWASATPPQPGQLSERIAAATQWKQSDIVTLLAAGHFNLDDRANFRSEAALVRLDKALAVAGKIGIDIDRLFDWAKPGSKFWQCHEIAESIRKTLRARFNEEDWEQVVRPLSDRLRENQRQALIAYLLVQQDLADWGVIDADSLFEFFLIDVQMGACMETSRIKQAISSVQLFVQRSFLGLEAKYGVAQDALDRIRWDWMRKYRVWEANRKVFAHPENWIDPALRDDKSSFCRELESELLQKDINTENVQDALKTYLYKVDDIAHLQVIGLHFDKGAAAGGRLHVFGRTQNTPHFFYYRYLDVDPQGGAGRWYPWEKMQIDIPSYEVTEGAFAGATGSGSYLTPVVWNNRLLVFFPEIIFKTRPGGSPAIRGSTADQTFSATSNPPISFAEIKLAWSEYRNGKWTQKQVSRDAVCCDMGHAAIAQLSLVPDILAGEVRINVFGNIDRVALGSGPDVSSWGPGRLDLFTRGTDNALWHRWFDGGWSNWECLGGNLASDPSAVSWGPGRIDVFAKGSDDALWHKWFDGSGWHEWESMGGKLTSGPDACSWSAGRLDVFARDVNSKLRHRWFDGENWGEEEFGGFPGLTTVGSAPGAVSWGAGKIDVFALDVSEPGGYGELMRFQEKADAGTSLGGKLKFDPDACSWGAGRLDVFALGENSDLSHIWYDTGKWSTWESLGGSLASAPGAVSWGKGRIDVFAKGTDNALWHRWHDNGWSDWEALPIDRIGVFKFVGSQLYGAAPIDQIKTDLLPDSFHFFTAKKEIHSLQLTQGGMVPELIQSEPYFSASDETQHEFFVHKDGAQHNFHHPYTHDLLGRIELGGLSGLYSYYADPKTTGIDYGEAFGDDARAVYSELRRSYSVYNWEWGFHVPMLLVDRMLKAQQFDQALAMMHVVLDPEAPGSGPKRFWKFPPFKEIDATKSVESLFESLQPNKSDSDVNDWRDRPFQPHVVARGRPAAYMKYAAMKYIEILIAYGDYYFRQLTLEAIPLAIQCYVLASHLLGPRRQSVPKRGKVLPQTYLGLRDKWDAFGNAMVELELVFPFSNQISTQLGQSNGVTGLANIFGFASTLYFCIPHNPKLKALRDTIDDRLFKVRHCQDIDGVYHKLPLFEPPIDPALLVQAEAQGLSLDSVLGDLNAPMPNYRFYYLLQKAFELCGEVKGLGNAFLSVREKGDAEAVARLRARHESSIQTLLMEVKRQQLDEAGRSLDALRQSRLGPVARMRYYLALIGEDASNVPNPDADFTVLPNPIEPPIIESGLRLLPGEIEDLGAAALAQGFQSEAGNIEVLASHLSALPNLSTNIEPFGVGVTMSIGGSNLAAVHQAQARSLQLIGSWFSYVSAMAGKMVGFLRAGQERIEQANQAGFEIKHIDRQILAQQIRVDIANREIVNQQQQIDNAREVEDFLRDKYTNVELYAWMEGELRTLYYQAYTLAYDLAKRAEKAFRFERGLASSNFIQFGYWSTPNDGLLAGERLYVGLKQLEAAYQDKRGYDFEISMPISLRQLNPLALLQLKQTGSCEFALPEVLFDMVRPGDYMRRIKSVALSIPCVVGPYTSLSATLRLLEHKFRVSSLVNGGGYAEQQGATDERFAAVQVPIAAIATSTGQSDSGVFELNFRDERYLPFEGAGAISRWRLELPAALRQFDYDTITDVVLHLRYTAIDGGNKLRQSAAGFVADYVRSVEGLSREEGLFALFDIPHDFPDVWYKAMQVGSNATQRVMTLDGLIDLLPIFAQGRPSQKIAISDLHMLVSSELPSNTGVLLTTDSGDVSPVYESTEGGLKIFTATDIDVSITGWQLAIEDTATQIDQLWLVVRYELL